MTDRNTMAAQAYRAALDQGLALPPPSRSRDYTSLQRGMTFGHRPRTKLDRVVAGLARGRTVEVGTGVGLRDLQERIHYDSVDVPIDSLWSHYLDPEENGERYAWDLDVDYQRVHVWTDRQASLFVGHLLTEVRVPLVWVRNPRQIGAYRPEVIDGKQRITACLRWHRGEIPALLLDGRELWFRDFNEIDRRAIPSLRIAFVDLPTRRDVLRFYLKLNAGGVVHTVEELDRVRALLAEEER